jgi:hypothetical protein
MAAKNSSEPERTAYDDPEQMLENLTDIGIGGD